MALFLAVLGGAAAVEIHRAISGPGKSIHELRKREEQLRSQLLEIQGELEKAKSMRDLTEKEKKQLEDINAQLMKDSEELRREKEELEQSNEELQARSARIAEREKLLEQCAESLKLENSMLIQQFEKLKIKHEEETTEFESQMKKLQKEVSMVLKKFTSGECGVKKMQEELRSLGVDFACPQGKTLQLADLEKANTMQERETALNKLKLEVGSSWIEQIHLNASPTRATKLFLNGTKEQGKAAAQKQPSVEDSIAAIHGQDEQRETKSNTRRVFGFRSNKKAVKKEPQNHLLLDLASTDVDEELSEASLVVM